MGQSAIKETAVRRTSTGRPHRRLFLHTSIGAQKAYFSKVIFSDEVKSPDFIM